MRCLDGPEAIRFKSSLDQSSDNWIVLVDRDHSIDGQAPGAGDLFLMLDPATVEHLVASQVCR